jgi:hypothetical protein
VLALIVFRVARRIVAIGYFVLYFFMGFAIGYGATVYATKTLSVPPTIPITSGLGFAVAASAIRAKLMRVVAAVMLVAVASLASQFWARYSKPPEVETKPAPLTKGIGVKRAPAPKKAADKKPKSSQ